MNWLWKVDLTPAQRWEDSASNLADWKGWDRMMRSRCGWLAGLAFWGKTNTESSRVLLSRHWPHRLCWSWSIRVGVRRDVEMDGPRRVSLGRRDRLEATMRRRRSNMPFVAAHLRRLGRDFRLPRSRPWMAPGAYRALMRRLAAKKRYDNRCLDR